MFKPQTVLVLVVRKISAFPPPFEMPMNLRKRKRKMQLSSKKKKNKSNTHYSNVRVIQALL